MLGTVFDREWTLLKDSKEEAQLLNQLIYKIMTDIVLTLKAHSTY